MAYEREFRIALEGSKERSYTLTLEDSKGRGVIHRKGRLASETGKTARFFLTHSPASARIFYLGKHHVTPSFARLLNLPEGSWTGRNITIPGQLILGAERTRLFQEAVDDCFRNPELESVISEYGQDRIVAVPVMREGVKYGISGVLNDRFDFFVDEVVADVAHTADESSSVYGRGVHVGVFKDSDVYEKIRVSVELAVVGDSVASGTVMLGLIDHMRERFPALAHIELICPLLTVHGLAHIMELLPEGITLRAHCLETILNALPPDFYWSAHYNTPEMHIRADLHKQYQQWWGDDANGNRVAETACAGFGWSEAFFNPRKQISLINQQLTERHSLTIAEIIARNEK